VFLAVTQVVVLEEGEIVVLGLAMVGLEKEVQREVPLELVEVGLALGEVEVLVKEVALAEEFMVIKEVAQVEVALMKVLTDLE
jgi:hypothetical protein